MIRKTRSRDGIDSLILDAQVFQFVDCNFGVLAIEAEDMDGVRVQGHCVLGDYVVVRVVLGPQLDLKPYWTACHILYHIIILLDVPEHKN